jgi:hypothetical protein
MRLSRVELATVWVSLLVTATTLFVNALLIGGGRGGLPFSASFCRQGLHLYESAEALQKIALALLTPGQPIVFSKEILFLTPLHY